ncbi:hypothetical protein GBAR_LOCUS3669, partial [Geodia barretti]
SRRSPGLLTRQGTVESGSVWPLQPRRSQYITIQSIIYLSPACYHLYEARVSCLLFDVVVAAGRRSNPRTICGRSLSAIFPTSPHPSNRDAGKLHRDAHRDSLCGAEKRLLGPSSDGGSDEGRRRSAGSGGPLHGGADSAARIPRQTRRERHGRAGRVARELPRSDPWT